MGKKKGKLVTEEGLVILLSPSSYSRMKGKEGEREGGREGKGREGGEGKVREDEAGKEGKYLDYWWITGIFFPSGLEDGSSLFTCKKKSGRKRK